jgi:predicted DNA-binding protein (MmcQ/YjbR family)
MNIEWLRQHCLSLPGATEQLQWGDDLVFKVAGKMFAVLPLEPARVWLSFKASPDEFGELVELRGIIPAPYLARAQWVALEAEDALDAAEVKRLLAKSHALVVAKLPRKAQQELQARPAAKRPSPRRKRR